MKKTILFFLLLISFFAFAQEHCNYSVTINSDSLKETGKFKLSVKNIGNKSFIIPKEINICNIILFYLDVFNEKTQTFEKMSERLGNADCFGYDYKYKKLKPSKTYTYEVNIKSDFESLQQRNFFETFNDRKYRFKIGFPLHSDKYGNRNFLTTDWIYKN